MKPLKNKLIRLVKRPVGFPSKDTWEYDFETIDELCDGEIIIQNLYISVDPAMRGWMNEVKSYIKPIEIGDVMRAGSIGKIIYSKINCSKRVILFQAGVEFKNIVGLIPKVLLK